MKDSIFWQGFKQFKLLKRRNERLKKKKEELKEGNCPNCKSVDYIYVYDKNKKKKERWCRTCDYKEDIKKNG